MADYMIAEEKDLIRFLTSFPRVAEIFRVLLVKTNMRLPYTSVFFELDCAYWNAQSVTG